jgi:hypothetical protein
VDENRIEMFVGFVPLFAIALFVWYVYRFLRLRSKHRPDIVKTQLGEITAKAYELHPTTLRLFQLRNARTASDQVGLEVWIPALSDYQRTSLTLTLAEARELVVLLERALAGPESANKSLQPTAANDAAAAE